MKFIRCIFNIIYRFIFNPICFANRVLQDASVAHSRQFKLKMNQLNLYKMNLPREIVTLIFDMLNVADFTTVFDVCREWRDLAQAYCSKPRIPTQIDKIYRNCKTNIYGSSRSSYDPKFRHLIKINN